MVEEIRDFLEFGGGNVGGDHEFFGCDFGCGDFETRGSLLLRLPSSPLRGCCGFGLRFFRPGHLLGGSHFRLLKTLRVLLRWIIRFGLEGGVVETLTTLPPTATWFHPSPCPSGRQTDWPAGFSERQGLWRRYFGCDPALALQGLPSPPSTLHSHRSTLCGFPSHSI